MDIGTIIAGIQAIGSLMNQPTQLMPAQAEGEKPKKTQQPMNTIFVLPNQTPPTGIGDLSSLLLPSMPSYWNELPPANVLRNPIWRMPQTPFGAPMFRGVPMTTEFPNAYEPSLNELYQLYFGTRR